MNNPFRFGEPVTGDLFLGRDDEISKVVANAREHENTAIYGERHIGKSSLLAETARRNARKFAFVKVDARAVVDESQFLDCFTKKIIEAGIGRAWRIQPALGNLLSTRRLRAVLAGYGDLATTDEVRMNGIGEDSGEAKEGGPPKPLEKKTPRIQMCPRCGRPLKWIEKYERHYCYGCKKYAPRHRRRAQDGAGKWDPSDTPDSCPVCSSSMRYVHRYSDYYCPECERYPLIERYIVSEPWARADMDAALDLPQKLAELKDRHVVMMIDDVDELGRLGDGRVAEAMRLKFEEHEDATYVFAGSSEESTRQMFEDRNGPFFKFAKTVELGRVADPEMRRFLMSRFRRGGGRLAESAADRIVGVSEGVPSYAQQIGHELFQISATPEVSDVDAAVRKTVRRHSAAYALLWDSIRSPLHRRYLFAIAKEPGAPHGRAFIKRYGLRSRSHVQRIQTQLEARGIVKRREILDPMFVIWLRLSNSL